MLLLSLILVLDFTSAWFINKKANFKLVSNPKYLIIGHSHSECAFNDSLIAGFKNISESGESYFYSYFKVKKLLEQNKGVETMFVEFTNNQIDADMDEWIWDDKHISNRYPKFSPFMTFEDNMLLLKNNPKGYLNAFSHSNKRKMNAIISQEYDYSKVLGGYLYLVRDKTDSLLAHSNHFNIKSKLKATNSMHNISVANLLYLDKIIKLCKDYKVKIVLVRSPQHQEYEGYINEPKYKAVLKRYYNDIDYIDFSSFPLSNSAFGDFEHLNHKGARIFSRWFNELIRDGLMAKTDKQQFVNEKITTVKTQVLYQTQ